MDSLSKTSNDPAFDVEIYKNKNETYGYTIFINKVKVIDQPTIPGLAGNDGFSTKEKASITGKFVARKILRKQFPPTVTLKELDSLKVLINQ